MVSSNHRHHHGHNTKVLEEGPLLDSTYFTRKVDLRSDETGSFMGFDIYHAQPACLGPLKSANNSGLFAL